MPGQKDEHKRKQASTVSEANSDESEDDVSQVDSQDQTLVMEQDEAGKTKKVPKSSAMQPASDAPTCVIAPKDYVKYYEGKARKKSGAEKKALFTESEVPTVLLQMGRENKQKQQTKEKTSKRTQEKTAGRLAPKIESQEMPTAMIAPTDYIDFMKDEKKPRLAGKKIQPVESDLPTKMIAPTDYIEYTKNKKVVKKTSRSKKVPSDVPTMILKQHRKSRKQPAKRLKKNTKKKKKSGCCTII